MCAIGRCRYARRAAAGARDAPRCVALGRGTFRARPPDSPPCRRPLTIPATGLPRVNTHASPATLERSLGFGSVVLTGVAYMAPMIVLRTFGVVAQASAGTVPTAYVVTLVAMLFTAYSYGRMASAFPVSGSAYTYVGKGIGPRLGFLAGWLILLDYFFLPLVIWLIGASYLSAEFPGVPMGVWIVGYIVITTALNIIGIKVATGVNFVLMTFQLLVLLCFVGLSFAHFLGADTGASLLTPIFNDHTTLGAISAGAALAAYSFIGFDAVTTLTEETREPRRNIPRAVITTALIGIVGLAALFLDVSTSTSFINFGAFSAFTLVNLSVIVHFWRTRQHGDAGNLFGWLLVPLVGAAIDAYLLYSLDTPAHVTGAIWLVLGLALLAWLTRGFKQPPPEMDIEE